MFMEPARHREQGARPGCAEHLLLHTSRWACTPLCPLGVHPAVATCGSLARTRPYCAPAGQEEKSVLQASSRNSERAGLEPSAADLPDPAVLKGVGCTEIKGAQGGAV